ncbi:hypothetical protein [Streptococcus sp. S784/96/1]|uniref:hypothetical protein n=1 Tax=Streptococcus sp. S784/96/1 TaxID=2653499 RepID=UPI00138A4482|nr:hypothetical protein [Streptococcus sp. S784/96/1]
MSTNNPSTNSLSDLIAFVALIFSIISIGVTVYQYNFPPKPDFKIIVKSAKSTNDEYAQYQIFVRNHSNGDGILKFEGLTKVKPKETNTEYFQLSDLPYSDKYYIFSANSISQEIVKFDNSFIKEVLKLDENQHFYVVFKDEQDKLYYEEVKVYSDSK